jgi:hypothetical protein
VVAVSLPQNPKTPQEKIWIYFAYS